MKLTMILLPNGEWVPVRENTLSIPGALLAEPSRTPLQPLERSEKQYDTLLSVPQ